MKDHVFVTMTVEQKTWSELKDLFDAINSDFMVQIFIAGILGKPKKEVMFKNIGDENGKTTKPK